MGILKLPSEAYCVMSNSSKHSPTEIRKFVSEITENNAVFNYLDVGCPGHHAAARPRAHMNEFKKRVLHKITNSEIPILGSHVNFFLIDNYFVHNAIKANTLLERMEGVTKAAAVASDGSGVVKDPKTGEVICEVPPVEPYVWDFQKNPNPFPELWEYMGIYGSTAAKISLYQSLTNYLAHGTHSLARSWHGVVMRHDRLTYMCRLLTESRMVCDPDDFEDQTGGKGSFELNTSDLVRTRLTTMRREQGIEWSYGEETANGPTFVYKQDGKNKDSEKGSQLPLFHEAHESDADSDDDLDGMDPMQALAAKCNEDMEDDAMDMDEENDNDELGKHSRQLAITRACLSNVFIRSFHPKDYANNPKFYPADVLRAPVAPRTEFSIEIPLLSIITCDTIMQTIEYEARISGNRAGSISEQIPNVRPAMLSSTLLRLLLFHTELVLKMYDRSLEESDIFNIECKQHPDRPLVQALVYRLRFHRKVVPSENAIEAFYEDCEAAAFQHHGRKDFHEHGTEIISPLTGEDALSKEGLKELVDELRSRMFVFENKDFYAFPPKDPETSLVRDTDMVPNLREDPDGDDEHHELWTIGTCDPWGSPHDLDLNMFGFMLASELKPGEHGISLVLNLESIGEVSEAHLKAREQLSGIENPLTKREGDLMKDRLMHQKRLVAKFGPGQMPFAAFKPKPIVTAKLFATAWGPSIARSSVESDFAAFDMITRISEHFGKFSLAKFERDMAHITHSVDSDWAPYAMAIQSATDWSLMGASERNPESLAAATHTSVVRGCGNRKIYFGMLNNGVYCKPTWLCDVSHFVRTNPISHSIYMWFLQKNDYHPGIKGLTVKIWEKLVEHYKNRILEKSVELQRINKSKRLYPETACERKFVEFPEDEPWKPRIVKSTFRSALKSALKISETMTEGKTARTSISTAESDSIATNPRLETICESKAFMDQFVDICTPGLQVVLNLCHRAKTIRKKAKAVLESNGKDGDEDKDAMTLASILPLESTIQYKRRKTN